MSTFPAASSSAASTSRSRRMAEPTRPPPSSAPGPSTSSTHVALSPPLATAAEHRAAASKARHSHHHLHHRPRRPKHFVHWFRKGLRISDNPALLRGVKRCETWRCIFILDPWFAGSSNQGVNKWRFLLQCLEDLDQSLRKLNSRLFVIRGQPADILPQLFKEWGTNYFSFEEDPEPYGQTRDKNIMAMCKEAGVTVVKEPTHTLYNLDK